MATAMVRARSGAEIPGHPGGGLDRQGEGGAKAAFVALGHERQVEPGNLRRRHGEANQAPAVCRHEVDHFRGRHLCRDDDIALVFAVFIVHQHEHAAVAGFFDDLFDRRLELIENGDHGRGT